MRDFVVQREATIYIDHHCCGDMFLQPYLLQRAISVDHLFCLLLGHTITTASVLIETRILGSRYGWTIELPADHDEMDAVW